MSIKPGKSSGNVRKSLRNVGESLENVGNSQEIQGKVQGMSGFPGEEGTCHKPACHSRAQ